MFMFGVFGRLWRVGWKNIFLPHVFNLDRQVQSYKYFYSWANKFQELPFPQEHFFARSTWKFSLSDVLPVKYWKKWVDFGVDFLVAPTIWYKHKVFGNFNFTLEVLKFFSAPLFNWTLKEFLWHAINSKFSWIGLYQTLNDLLLEGIQGDLQVYNLFCCSLPWV